MRLRISSIRNVMNTKFRWYHIRINYYELVELLNNTAKYSQHNEITNKSFAVRFIPLFEEEKITVVCRWKGRLVYIIYFRVFICFVCDCSMSLFSALIHILFIDVTFVIEFSVGKTYQHLNDAITMFDGLMLVQIYTLRLGETYNS